MIRDLRKGFVMAAGAALFTVTATLAVRALTPAPADGGGGEDPVGGIPASNGLTYDWRV